MSRICLTTLLLLMLLSGCALPGGEVVDGRIGLVTSAEGEPGVFRGNRYIALGVRSAIEAGDTLITGPEDSVSLTLSDGTELSAGRDTQLDIHEYVFLKSGGQLRLSVSSGNVLVSLGKIMRRQEATFTLTTPFADISAQRPSQFWLGHETEPSRLNVLLLNNEALSVGNEFGVVDLSGARQATTTQFGIRPGNPERWSSVRVTETLRRLEALPGVPAVDPT